MTIGRTGQGILAKIRASRGLRFASVLSSVSVIVLMVLAGIHMQKSSRAADRPGQAAEILSLAAPAAVSSESSMSVALLVDSRMEPINVVQAKVTYPADSLRLDRVDESPAFPVSVATDLTTPGALRLARSITSDGSSKGEVSGRVTLATLHFTVLPAAADAVRLEYDTDASFVIRSRDGQNILSAAGGATVRIQDGER